MAIPALPLRCPRSDRAPTSAASAMTKGRRRRNAESEGRTDPAGVARSSGTARLDQAGLTDMDNHFGDERIALGADAAHRSRRGWPSRLAVLVIAVCAFGCFLPAITQGYTGINLWLTETSTTQAGGHPDIGIHVNWNNRLINNSGAPAGEPCNECQDAKDIITQMPTGLIGNPNNLPRCKMAEFALKEC